ncbi:hypothetical protein AVEN_229328-1 [Araneus ventricosus]|uniref:Uncharacterized protein n=1 Tax=Araneus ventricosus TaxID=182803 RepID=A0A4Y2PCH1_ARAVE|nr:hypothetical protein AVEN_212610-1 [Araneus ventricosus]GBN48931.1 hypothetical protein AVEN_119635-1 [Araneus ventricosus]GBN57818.1 hypothetical protein AVEN_103166-1 [Araneus ventricosus]GBN57841.1 hypothetical protein AVEN_229328-1 [Araneus ventricosus]
MKPFQFKFGRKQETDNEEDQNVIQIEESDDEDFGFFQQEIEAAEMEEVIYLESSMLEFSTNLFVSIYNLGDARMNAHYSYSCWIQEANGGKN